MRKEHKKGRRGFTLLATIFILLVLVLISSATLTLVSTDAVSIVRNYSSSKAFYIATAGTEYYFNQLENDSDWAAPPTGEVKAFSGGTFSLTPSSEGSHRISFTSTSLLTAEGRTYKRTISISVRRTSLGAIAEEYVVYLGGTAGGTTSLSNNVTVTGDIFVYDDINLNNCIINGDVSSTGDITNSSGTSGDVEENADPPANLPVLDPTYYNSYLATAATYPIGNQSYSGSLAPGTYYVKGNVSLGNLSLSGATKIVATGSVTVSNNATVGNNLEVIAGGAVIIGNNVDLGIDGLWYSSTSIAAGNQGEIADLTAGNGTVFISPGAVSFGNTCEFNGLIYSGAGAILGNGMIFNGLLLSPDLGSIGNNSQLSLNSTSLNYDNIPGLSLSGPLSLIIKNWQEVY